MVSFRIVEHLDVVEHILPGVGPGFISPAPYPFALEQIEKALDHRVVMTVPASAHRVFQIVMLQERCPVHTGELRTLIGGKRPVNPPYLAGLFSASVAA